MMQKIFLLWLYSGISCYSFAQSDPAVYLPKETEHHFSWENKTTTIFISQYGDREDIVMLNLHDDETTSVEAARKILKVTGGLLIRIENNGERLISFEKRGRKYQFDPNRTFTSKGVQPSLKKLNRNLTSSATRSVQSFGQFILKLIPRNTSILIALHNNDDGRYSVNYYKPRAVLAKDALKLYTNPSHDPDDFFLTTSLKIYERLKSEKYNVMLQNNSWAKDDGSLSIYYGKRKKIYVNVESEHGHLEEQTEMIKVLVMIANN